MIYDARTNPRGYKLSISGWPRHPEIMAKARVMGYRIPAPNFVAAEATPARALLNHGVWRAWCPDCPFSAEDVWRGHNLFWCMRCGNLKAGRAWRPLIWPDNLAEIESNLDRFPPQAQNWEPWGAAVDYVAVAEDWVAHAAVMVDPEHGLSDNEVGGEDDPETYTVPVLAVTNAIIASSDANVDKGDIRYFRQFLSANPAAANYWLQSSGTDAAAWVSRATAFVAAMAEIASANVGGTLSWTDNQEGVALSSGGFLRDINASGTYLNTNLDAFYVQTEDGITTIFRALNGEAEPYFKSNKIWHAGNDGASSGLDADTVDGLQPGNSSGNIAVANGTVVTNLNADTLDGIQGSVYAKIATGSYTGDGTENRTITTTGITPILVILKKASNGNRYLIDTTADALALSVAFGTVDGATARIVSGGFEVDSSDGSNENAVSYTWTALG